MKVFYFVFLIIFVFAGCVKEPVKSEKFSILIKSPFLKLNDFGFKTTHKNTTNLQIYSTGQGLLNMKIGDKICINQACLNEEDFNKKFFLNAHYDGFFKSLINGDPIYYSNSLVKTDCGFEQNIRKISVKYQICDKNIKFIDDKNGVKIIMKRLD